MYTNYPKGWVWEGAANFPKCSFCSLLQGSNPEAVLMHSSAVMRNWGHEFIQQPRCFLARAVWILIRIMSHHKFRPRLSQNWSRIAMLLIPHSVKVAKISLAAFSHVNDKFVLFGQIWRSHFTFSIVTDSKSKWLKRNTVSTQIKFNARNGSTHLEENNSFFVRTISRLYRSVATVRRFCCTWESLWFPFCESVELRSVADPCIR